MDRCGENKTKENCSWCSDNIKKIKEPGSNRH